MSWKKVKIGDFLKRSKIPIDIEDQKIYNRVTIRGKHLGVSLRDSEIGKKIGTKKQFILRKGQFVLSKIDARYGAFGIAPEETDGAIITGNFWAYDVDKSIMNIDWLNQYTNSIVFYNLCERASSGITHRKYLDEKFFLNHELLIPDITEQKSHVASIVEKKGSINIIGDEIFNQLSLIKNLRQQILQDAVQGKLVQQDPNDEPASKLLERIKAEKQHLIKEGKTRKENPLPPIKSEEMPFEVPGNWVWCRFGEICEESFYRPRYSNSDYVQNGIPTIRTTDMTDDGKIRLENTPCVQINDAKKVELYKVIDGDLLLTRSGSIGTMAVFRGNYLAIPSAYLIRFRFFKSLYPEYIYYLLKSPYWQELLGLNSKATAQVNINAQNIIKLPFPLPSVDEQHRIVNKIEQLMKHCDELEQTIRQNQKHTQELLQVALKEALEPKG